MAKKDTMAVITVRVPPEVLKRLPKPSLTGKRAAFIRDAIEEKLERQAAGRKNA